jgi:hypothetical protein
LSALFHFAMIPGAAESFSAASTSPWDNAMYPRKPIIRLAFVLIVAASAPVYAQTCASPDAWQPTGWGDSWGFDTCTGDTSGASLMCGGVHDRVGPVYVALSHFNSNRQFSRITLAGATAGFDPVMYMTSAAGGCGANQEGCFPSGDTGSPMHSADIPNGDWLILVTAFEQNTPGSCGFVTLTSDGPFTPVTLQRFTVD